VSPADEIFRRCDPDEIRTSIRREGLILGEMQRVVFGVDERLIVLAPGIVRGTSPASETRLGDHATVLLHPRCAAPGVAVAPAGVGSAGTVDRLTV
jgi:hypothetical protein